VWWTLRWAGHQQVSVLDGGYAAWLEAGGASTTIAPPTPAPGDIVVHPGSTPTWTAAEAAKAGAPKARAAKASGNAEPISPTPALIDARVPERFRGEVEPIDPVAGHIPGAVNVPIASIVDERGRLRAPAELRVIFAGALGREPAGDEPIGAYCGSGITAAQTALALDRAGLQPALYVGSWSDWITDDTRPVATGEA
jgi:thiosulfate/3-mercaptopyruvate sulfurtransferase